MKKIRVYDLAKELGLKNPEMVKILKDLGLDVKGALASVDEETAEIIKEIAKKEEALKSQPVKARAHAKEKGEKSQKVKEVVETPKNKKTHLKEAPLKETLKEKELLSEKVKKAELKKVFTSDIPLEEFSLTFNISLKDLTSFILKMGVSYPEDGILKNVEAQYLGYLINKEKIKEPDLVYLKNFYTRPPVVTVMGHVDHGKTTLLDYIRRTSVALKEKGGITQKIGASEVEVSGHKIIFIDTPGHEAFTMMRLRGSQVTDIVILVVDAEEGAKEQTIEALDHAKAAGVPIIVALNKIDKEGANPEKVKQQLADRGLQPEEWGGETIFVPISAKKGTNVDTLLEMILLQAEMMELKTQDKGRTSGSVIEAKSEKNVGVTAVLLVQTGTLKVGQDLRVGDSLAKIKRINDTFKNNLKEVKALKVVEAIGFQELPQAGEIFYQISSPQQEREKIEIKKEQEKMAILKAKPVSEKVLSLDELFKIEEEAKKSKLLLIVKTDSFTTLDAVKNAIKSIKVKAIPVEIIHEGVGGITKSDVLLASASKALILGFNVVPQPEAGHVAAEEYVEIRTYDLIFELSEAVEGLLTGMVKPKVEEIVIGKARVKEVFKVSDVGNIAGCIVEEGKIIRDYKARVIRNSIIIYNTTISSLKRFKEDQKEVLKGYECGIGLQNFNDIKIDDYIEVLKKEEVS